MVKDAVEVVKVAAGVAVDGREWVRAGNAFVQIAENKSHIEEGCLASR